jgi:fatty acid desaturase
MLADPVPAPADRRLTGGDVVGLRRDLATAGVFDHHTATTWAKLVGLLVAVAGLVALALAAPTAVAWLLVPLIALPLTSAVMIGHEAGHRSFAARPWHNELVLHLVFPLLGGLGALHWKRKHNAIHHGHPNVVGIDDDIDLWPFALEPDEHARSARFRRWFHRHLQGPMFFPLSTFLGFVMRLASIRHSAAELRRGGVTRAWAIDVACLVGHYVLWLVVPGLALGWGVALGGYVGVWACVGVYLAMIFTPAHLGLPLVGGDPRGWPHQLASTRNLRLPRWAAWSFIGLDWQVEHHLFPTIPHQNLGRAGAIVEAWCRDRGLPYQSLAYGAALRDVRRFVGSAWRAPA